MPSPKKKSTRTTPITKFIATIMRNRLILAFLALFASPLMGYAQTAVVISPAPNFYYTDGNGNPLAFGCVFSYQSGTTTPLATYTDSTGNTQNANPVVLSASGRAQIWLQTGVAYTLKIKSSGGVNCASGAQLASVDGIGGGLTTISSNVTFSSTPTFTIAGQNQLFRITLTGNASANPITGVGIAVPALVAFEITQDSSGGHTFSWPANSVGGCTIGSGANQTTVQFGHWDGTTLYFDGPCVTGNGPIVSAGNIFDLGLTASGSVCTDTNKQLTSTGCGSINGITVNGQSIPSGGTGNVNVGAAAHSVALNEGNGSPLTGVTLGASQIAVGVASADPVPSTLPTCTGGQFFTFSGTLPITCTAAEAVQASSITLLGSPVNISGGTAVTILTKAVTMPSAGCPCRAFVSYGINFDGTNSGEVAVAVNDGTNTFATGVSNQTGSASNFGVQAASYSTGTYANSAAITFTLQGATTMAGTTNAHVANGTSLGQASYMNVAIFPSN